MAKTLVCTIEEEAILNYLFVKEMYSEGDTLLLVSQFKFAPQVERYKTLFKDVNIESIVLAKDGDEDLWDTICRTIRAALSPDKQYAVNLSSGSRLMSIAVQQVFERFNSQFYFMPHDRNVIIHSQIDDNNDNNDDQVTPIKYQVSVDEYFNINDIHCSRSKPSRSIESATKCLEKFTKAALSNQDYAVIDNLTSMNNKVIPYSMVPGLKEFVKKIDFQPAQNDCITRGESKYITGGWFEEYIYFMIRQLFIPSDVATGVVIRRNQNANNDVNELDVVFTYKNRLFAIECKTGVGKPKRYHQTVYKACALHEALLGMRSNAYIFSLNDDPKDILKVTARNMNITFCDCSYALRPTKMINLFQNPSLYI